MTAARRQHRPAGDEGSVLVTVALALPVFLALLVFVVDLANFFEHKRHLQVQAAAAVLAAVHELRAPCTDAPAIGRANQYGGLASYTGGGPFNVQVGGSGSQGSIHGLINSRTFYGQSAPTDDTVDTGSPCTSRMVDMKLTESGLPLFFGLARFSNINAHARAEVRKLRIARNFIPLSVSDAVWKRGAITFYDESSGTPGTVLGTRSITPNGTSGGGLAIWDNASNPLSVNFAGTITKLGVRVALSTGSTTTCGDSGVTCYDQVLFARGWQGAPAVTTSSATSGGAPKARSVSVTGASCNDGSFTTTATTTGASCTVTIAASVDWGQTNPSSNSVYNASMTATVNGASVTLTPPASGPQPGIWTGTLSIPASGGALPITLDWAATKGTIAGNACKTNNQNPCKGTFGTVQRTFSSSTSGSGPIQAAELWNGSSLATAVKQSSFRQCDSGNALCTYPLIVRVGLPPSLGAAQAVSDPVYRMRPLDGNSQTHALDCDSALSKLEDELAFGCGSQANSSPKGYTINSGQACSSYNNPGALPDPSPCAVTQTGQSASQIGKGLNLRVYGDTKPHSCPASGVNHWSSFPNLSSSDPRLVYVLLTDYGSFTGNGNEGFPVRNFAAFYITGWQGNAGFDNPCQGHGDDAAATGEVVGHFINYVEQVNDGGAGDELCDLTALSLCAPVLTR